MGVRTTPRIPQNQSHPLTGQDEHDYYKARASVENSSNLVLKEEGREKGAFFGFQTEKSEQRAARGLT